MTATTAMTQKKLDSASKTALLRKQRESEAMYLARERRRRKAAGNIERRGTSSRVRIMVGGTRYRFTIQTTDRALVADFVKRKRAELTRQHARRVAGFRSAMRFSELLDAFEREDMPTLSPGAQEAYSDSIAPIRDYFVTELGDPAVDTIQAREIIGFMAWRRVHRRVGKHGKATKEPLSNRSVSKDRSVLHRIFDKAVRLEVRDGNPVARTEAPKVDTFNPVILTSEEYDRLIRACARRPMLELYVLVLGEAGLRADTEGLMLQWEDVDLDGGFLSATSGRGGHRTKSGKSRWVPMTTRLKAAMKDHFARYRFATYNGKRTPWVFHHDHNHHKCKAGERIKSLFHGYKLAAKRAKLLPTLRQHDLRHRRVTVWLAEGKSPALVKEAMGHSDLRTTMGYAHMAREHLRALVEELPATAAGANNGPIEQKAVANNQR
jgi:integrase